MERYKEMSRKIMTLLRDFSPRVEVVSIDEAYMDISGSRRLQGDPEKVAIVIKNKIKARLGLTCSVGVAPGKFLAKVASDMDKPDGLTIIRSRDVDQFIRRLPVQKVPGVGKKTYLRLEAMGIKNLGDINNFPEKMLLDRLGKFGHRLIELAAGTDHSKVTPWSPHKSISSERTLPEDTRDKKVLYKHLLKQSEEVSRQLAKSGFRARTITLKIKHADFKQFTRSKTISIPTRSSETIYRHAADLLDNYRLTQQIRLIGVGTSGFTSASLPVQLDLFDRDEHNDKTWEKVDRTVESIAQKFGRNAIKRGTLSH
jgi:DNA polymerase-4